MYFQQLIIEIFKLKYDPFIETENKIFLELIFKHLCTSHELKPQNYRGSKAKWNGDIENIEALVQEIKSLFSLGARTALYSSTT